MGRTMCKNNLAAVKPRTRILFRSQLVLLLALILFAIIFSSIATSPEKSAPRKRPGQHHDIRR